MTDETYGWCCTWRFHSQGSTRVDAEGPQQAISSIYSMLRKSLADGPAADAVVVVPEITVTRTDDCDCDACVSERMDGQ
jgi:hypothetical protein